MGRRRGCSPFRIGRESAAAVLAAPHLLELGGLALEAPEGLERLFALLGLAETAVETRLDVVVRGGFGIQRDRLVQRIDGFAEAPLALVALGLEEPGPVGLGIELERLFGMLERAVGIARAVVIARSSSRGGRRSGRLPPRRRRWPFHSSRRHRRRRPGPRARTPGRPGPGRNRGRAEGRLRAACARAPSCPGSRRACRGCSGPRRSPACSGGPARTRAAPRRTSR